MKRVAFSIHALLLAAILGASSQARASASFPLTLQEELELAEIAGPAPGCRLCHEDDVGGLKTAVMPFGRAVTTAGTTGGNVPSLIAAIRTLDADRVDSDDDGNADIDELRVGDDPNVATTDDGTVIPREEIPLPRTGCELGGPPRRAGGDYSYSFVALALLWFRRLKSRRRVG